MRPFQAWAVRVSASVTAALALVLVVLTLAGCATTPPAGLSAVTGFQPERYLGTWYEIARYDHRFERGLTHVSATYTKGADGRIQVLNRGYDTGAGRWQEIRGTARLQSADGGTGSLLVTFFPPFEAGYHVIALDQAGYRWAVVAGPNRDYLWLLSRTPRISAATRATLLRAVTGAGYDLEKLIDVPQDSPPPALMELPRRAE